MIYWIFISFFFLHMEQMSVLLSIPEWNIVIEWLRELPLKKVESIIAKIVDCHKAGSSSSVVVQTEEVSLDEGEEDEQVKE
jgi:hypothetical protein